MAEPDIIQRILLQGADTVRKELKALGADGEKALKQLEQAGKGDIASGLERASPRFARFRAALNATAGDTQKATRVFHDFFGESVRVQQGLGGLPDSMGKTARGAKQIATEVTRATRPVRALTDAFRLLGAGVPGLSRITTLTNTLGRNLSVLAGPAIVGALGFIARSASEAAEKIANLSNAAQTTTEDFQNFSKIGVAVGVSMEDGQKSAGRLQAALSKARQESIRASQAYKTFQNSLRAARDRAADLSEEFVDLQKSQEKLRIARLNAPLEQDVGKQIAQMQARREEDEKLAAQFVKTARASDEADRAARELEISYRASRDTTAEASTGLLKLGVAIQNTNKDSINYEKTLIEFSEAFRKFPEGAEKSKIAQEIFGESTRRMLPILNSGKEGIKAFLAEAQRISPNLSEAQIAVGTDFRTKLTQLSEAFANLKNQIGLAISPAFTIAFEAVTNAIVNARPVIVQLASALGGSLKFAFESVIGILRVAGEVFTGWTVIAQGVATAINNLFGTEAIDAGKVFLGVIVLIIATFAPMAVAIGLAVIAVGALVNELAKLDWTGVKERAQAAWDFITSLFTAQFWIDLWNSMANAAGEQFDRLVNYFRQQWEGFLGWFQGGWLNTILGVIGKAIEKAKQLASLLFSSSSNAGTGQARGGPIRGPGSGTSDSIGPFWLSDGEYVLRAKAARKYGTRFLNALNNMRFDPALLRGHGMAQGGLVSDTIGRGSGSRSTSRSAFDLVLDSVRYSDLTGPPDVLERLEKVAVIKRLSSGGTPPRWKGSR